MARKRQEVQLQQEIETQEEWEDMVSKEGVWVVDVYQEWCGPCQGMSGNFRKYRNEISDELLKFAVDWCGPTAAMVGTFKRIKLDLGDALLNFAVAKADTIDSLERYRGRCEPCFLFYAGGVLVAVVRGANAPLILRTITEQLAYEHKVIEGAAERKEVKDTVIAMLEKEKKEDEEEDEKEEGRRMKFKGEIIDYGDSLDMSARETEMKKEVTICLIKPDAVQAGKADDIKNELRQRGIEILREEERQLTEDEANLIYGNLKDQTFYPDLIKFMTSGPSHILVITKGKTGQNIIREFRELMGPTNVEEAKEKAPESLRAKYGQDTMMNCLHGSSSEETAMNELGFFFPDFVAPPVEGKPKLQRTLALIRPDAFKMHKDAILQKIKEAGFRVAMEKEVRLSKEQAEDFYSEHKDQPYFEQLTTRMTSGPLLALGLAREDAVQGWRHMLGPTEVEKAKEEAPDSLRAQFSVEDIPINQLHGSSSEADAEKELKFFFPVEQTVAVIKPDAYGTKEEIIEKIHEAGFRIAARKETKLTQEMAEEFYADHKDKEYFNDLVQHMISGPTFFMVLTREDAVEGWRAMIGPTDPEKAKEDPETLRAQYGKDVLRNAVHGSSNPEHAKESIKKIFGDLRFTPDGTVKEEGEAKRNRVISVNVEQPKSQQTAEQLVPEAGIKAESKAQGASVTQESKGGNESKTAESLITVELKTQEASLTQGSKGGEESKTAELAITVELKPQEASLTQGSKGGEESKTAELAITVELKTQEASLTQGSKGGEESKTAELAITAELKTQVASVTQESNGRDESKESESSVTANFKPQEVSVIQESKVGDVSKTTIDHVQQNQDKGQIEQQSNGEAQVHFQSGQQGHVEGQAENQNLQQDHHEGQAQNKEPVNVVREDSAEPAPEYQKSEAEEQEGVEEHAEGEPTDEDKEGKEAQPETTDEQPSEAEAMKEKRKDSAMKEERKEEKPKAETPQPPPEPEPEPAPEEKQEPHKAKSPEPAEEEESRKVEEDKVEEPKKDKDEGADEEKEGGQGKDKEQEEVTGSGEAQSKGEDSKPEESNETEAKPSSETEAKPSSETEAKPSGETEAKPDDKEGVEQRTEEKEEVKDGGHQEGET